jgi:hypothetical protein
MDVGELQMQRDQRAPQERSETGFKNSAAHPRRASNTRKVETGAARWHRGLNWRPADPLELRSAICCRSAGRLRGVTVKAVATALDIPLKSGNVSAEGDLDFRGTLGVAKDAPVGFAQIRLRIDLDTDAAQEKLDQLLKLTERYCVVYQTIKSGPPVDVQMKRV